MYVFVLMVFILLNIVCDVNYLTRTIIAVFSGRFYQRTYSLNDTSEIYGVCTFQDCDVTLKFMRIARLLRDLDFARYHFYERTGIYRRSQELSIKSLQGCTLTSTDNPVPLFGFYKITTELVYWDNRSLFLEHKVITLGDGKIRSILVSRQHAIGQNGDSTEALLAGLPGSDVKPACPEYIQYWLRSMEMSSSKNWQTFPKEIIIKVSSESIINAARVNDTTTIYGFCTTQDVDIFLRHMNNARYVRELDFARFHFYDRTGIYANIKTVDGHALQGASSIRYRRTIPIFSAYKVETKLVYWEDKTLFIEQKFITLSDGFVRAIVLSRQNLINVDAQTLFIGIPGNDKKPECPEEIKHWLQAIEVSSARLRKKD
ncbi:unnamed protein product [Arctia plantaginis]|uniref:Protein THEM6 n=1 Tax=Arctia plantaginis TaxID=874455 RepID=A0A8S1AED0_ARCPL|nr:unnamed protein product [Arctia plantaginis]